MKSKRVLRVGGAAIVTFLALGACGAVGAADGGKLIASSEPDWPQWRGQRRDAVNFKMWSRKDLKPLSKTFRELWI